MKQLLIIASLVLAGCGATLTAAGDSVRVTGNPETIKGAQYITTLQEASVYGSKSAMAIIRNKAAAAGGDVAFIVSEAGVGGSAVSITAEVYRTDEKQKPGD